MEVKQVFGLEFGRSALTGVGFILLDGLVPLKNNQRCYNKSGKKMIKLVLNFVKKLCGLTQVKWVMTQLGENLPNC